MNLRHLALVFAAAGLFAMGAELASAMRQTKPGTANRQLLIVLDGLRPDYVTPELMPNLHALVLPAREWNRPASPFETQTARTR